MTKLSKSYTETIAFDIAYKNVPEEHLISTDSTKKIMITVDAYGFNLLRYSFYRPSLEIDFSSDVVQKDNTYIWNAIQNSQKIGAKFKNSVNVIAVQPDTLKFNFQALEVRRVPVKANVSIDFASGYDMLKPLKISPDTIKIIGSKKWVRQVEYVSTQKIELKNVNSNIDQMVEIDYDESLQHLKTSRTKVNVSGKVEKFTEGTFNVPISIINMPVNTHINFFPKAIPVAYNVSLNNYKLVKPSDFRVECDFRDINNTEKTFLIPKLVKVPDLVKSARLKNKKVEFVLLK